MVSGHSVSWSAIHCETESYAFKDARYNLNFLVETDVIFITQSTRYFSSPDAGFCCVFLKLIPNKNPLLVTLPIHKQLDNSLVNVSIRFFIKRPLFSQSPDCLSVGKTTSPTYPLLRP